MITAFLIVTVIYYLILVLWIIIQRVPPKKEKAPPREKKDREAQIVGESSYVKSRQQQDSANPIREESKMSEPVKNEHTFAPEPETDAPLTNQTEGEASEVPSVIIIPFEELDDVFSDTLEMDEADDDFEEDDEEEEDDEPDVNAQPDVSWEDEEEVLNRLRNSDDDLNSASGVGYEELEKLGVLLQKEELGRDEMKEVGETLGKVAGTELLESMLSALPDAIRKVSGQIESQLAESRKNNERIPEWTNFDIANYL